jgi:hypothetical protein
MIEGRAWQLWPAEIIEIADSQYASDGGKCSTSLVSALSAALPRWGDGRADASTGVFNDSAPTFILSPAVDV